MIHGFPGFELYSFGFDQALLSNFLKIFRGKDRLSGSDPFD